MRYRCSSTRTLSLFLGMGLAVLVAAFPAQAQTPPIVDGNIDDLLDFAATNELGCGLIGGMDHPNAHPNSTAMVDDVCSDRIEVLIPCSPIQVVPCGNHFRNGYDLVEWGVAKDGPTGILYLGLRVDGIIGDTNGDDDPGIDPALKDAVVIGARIVIATSD